MKSNDTYHVGIILDGNGRWAHSKNRPRLEGHVQGFKNIKKIAQACKVNKVNVLSVYAFAIANWKRDQTEVEGLWNIFRNFFDIEMEEICTSDIRLKMIGDRTRIPVDVCKKAEKAERDTLHNKGSILQFALNYDGVDEVVRATHKIVQKIQKGELVISDIDEKFLNANLDTSGVKEPDIIIRTGMPQLENKTGMATWRSSSFLQLQSAQAVCVSTPTLWPDFSPEDLAAAISYAKPDERLYGGQRN